MSLSTNILAILMYYNGGYRLVRERIHNDIVSDNTLRATLSRMKKAGLVSNKAGAWNITPRGRTSFAIIQQKIKQGLPLHISKQKNLSSRPKTMIVTFDIPETRKRERAWLRIELANLGFAMLQKSVWLGPSPLPKKFIESLDHMKLLSYIKFFKATTADIV